MSDTGQQLEQAYSLIKNGREKEAVALLMPILKTDKNNANAWWLMANALEKPEHVRAALENVLRLRPNNDKARQMLVKVNTLYPAIGTSNGDAPPAAPHPVQPIAPKAAPQSAPQSAPHPAPKPAPPPAAQKPAPDPFDDPFAAPSAPIAKPAASTPDPFDEPFAKQFSPEIVAAPKSDPLSQRVAPQPDPFDDPFSPPPVLMPNPQSPPQPAPQPAAQAASRPHPVGIAGFIPFGGQNSPASAPVYDPFAAPAGDPLAAPVKSQPQHPPQRQPQPPARPAASADDSFDDDPFGDDDDPFGESSQSAPAFVLPITPPIAPPPARTTNGHYHAPTVDFEEDDPFPDDDPFGEEEDLFADVASDASDPFADLQTSGRQAKQSAGGLPLPALLLILTLIAAIVIIPLVLLRMGDSASAAPAETANFEQLVAQADEIAPRDVEVLGVIGVDELRTESVSDDDKDGWAFAGQSGQFVVIELTAIDDIYFDPHLTLIAPDGDVIASNDDIVFAVNLNSRVSLRLPEDGIYLIVVEDHFGMALNGDYELIVRVE